MHPPLVIVYHRDIHRIWSFRNLLRLLERFVLEIEPVVAHLMVVVLGDSVKPLMHKHGADNRAEGIHYAVCREAEYRQAPFSGMEDEAQCDKRKPGQHRIYHHSPEIELQSLLSLGADAHDAYTYQLRYLTSCHGAEHLEASEQVEDELRHTVVRRYRQIHHNLDYQEDVDAATEVVIHLLLFLCFLKSHTTYVLKMLLL